MRLRMFALLLATTAFAACNGDYLPADPSLTGSWESTWSTGPRPFPGGARTVNEFTQVYFGDNHAFQRVRYLVDTNQVTIIDQIDQGTFTAQGGTVWARVDHSYARGAGEPLDNPIPQSVDRTDEYRYSVNGDALTLSPQCPPNASCIEPVITVYGRLRPID